MKPTGLQRAVYKLILNSKTKLDSYEIAEMLNANQRGVMYAVKALVDHKATDILIDRAKKRTRYSIGTKTPCNVIFPVLPTDLARSFVLNSDKPVNIAQIVEYVGAESIRESQARNSLVSLKKQQGDNFVSMRINNVTHYQVVDLSKIEEEETPTEINAVDLLFMGDCKQAAINMRFIQGM